VQDLERGLRRTPYAETLRRVAAALELDEPQRAALVAATGQPDCANRRLRIGEPVGLPLSLTSFIGREVELAYLTQQLGTTRLLMLTGPAGIGKTRLALEMARSVQGNDADRVCFADLASLSDSAVLVRTIAAACGVREQPERPVQSSLVDALRMQQILL